MKWEEDTRGNRETYGTTETGKRIVLFQCLISDTMPEDWIACYETKRGRRLGFPADGVYGSVAAARTAVELWESIPASLVNEVITQLRQSADETWSGEVMLAHEEAIKLLEALLVAADTLRHTQSTEN